MILAAVSLDPPEPPKHVTVLRDEVVSLLDVGPGVILDLTAGGGGHSEAILQAHPEVRVLAFDRDAEAVKTARKRLEAYGQRCAVVQASFAEVEARLAQMHITRVRGVLADLGISSVQLDDERRGMSFRHSGPIDMRMDQSSGETALELIERLSADELANVIYQFGEERRSRRVARCIKQASDNQELETTADLRRAVVRAVGPHRVGGVDPATKTFQALRIAVNGELDQLRSAVGLAERVLAHGGRAAFISFHSLEDRIVKQSFQDSSLWEKLHKKPVTASEEELANNPRSRSAKLRVAARVRGEEP